MIPDPRTQDSAPMAIVLDILSKKPRLSVKDLYAFFSKRYEPGMSLQGFYNLIKKLVNARVLVKEGKLILIDASWIYSLLNFSNVLQQNYFESSATAANIILNEGEEKTFTFDTPIAMDNFWWHTLILVILYYDTEQHKDKNAYVYLHHSWYHLIRSNSEETLNNAYKTHDMHLYLVNGSSSFLDSLTPQLIADDDDVDVQHKEVSGLGPNYYVIVIGDFIFETKLPTYIYKQMEEMYDSVTHMAQFDASAMMELVQQPGKTDLLISRDKKRAESLRKTIRTCFGPAKESSERTVDKKSN